jgi:hypothetical protein
MMYMDKPIEAAKWFAELWGSGNFDCGPEDYEFMVKKCIEAFNTIDELEDALDLPEVQRRLHEPTIPLARVKEELDI